MVDHGVDVAAPLDRVNVGKMSPPFDQCLDRQWNWWEWSKFGDRLSRTGNDEMFAAPCSFDYFAAMVAQLSNRYGAHTTTVSHAIHIPVATPSDHFSRISVISYIRRMSSISEQRRESMSQLAVLPATNPIAIAASADTIGEAMALRRRLRSGRE